MPSMNTTSTSLLIRLRQSSDRAAWSRFVHLYGPLIYKWAQGTGLQSSDAADLVQDVMTQLVSKLPEFRYDKSRSFRSWLKTVTLNKWRERFRKRSLPMSDATASGLARVPDSSHEDFWESHYRQEVVARAIAMMKNDFKPTTWQACERYIIGGESPDDLAEEFGVSVWTIYSAKSRLIKRLRDELDGLLD